MRRGCDLEWRDRYFDGVARLEVRADRTITADPSSTPPSNPHVVDVGRLHALATLLRGITDTTRIHTVNTPLLASVES